MAIPVAAPIDATEVALELQVPQGVEFERSVVPPPVQIVDVPEIEAGVARTVTMVTAEQEPPVE